MKHFKLNITAADLTRMYGCSDRQGFRLMLIVRKKCKKKKHDLITTIDICKALDGNKEQLDDYFYKD